MSNYDKRQERRSTSGAQFITKDNGKRVEFASGFLSEPHGDKPRYDLVDKVFYKRLALLMSRGAKKYKEHNWEKASTQEEIAVFKAKAERHLMDYLEGDEEEDHAAAVVFNLMAAEFVKRKLENPPTSVESIKGPVERLEEKMLVESAENPNKDRPLPVAHFPFAEAANFPKK